MRKWIALFLFATSPFAVAQIQIGGSPTAQVQIGGNGGSDPLTVQSTAPILINGASGPIASGTATFSCPTCGASSLQDFVSSPSGNPGVLVQFTASSYTPTDPCGLITTAEHTPTSAVISSQAGSLVCHNASATFGWSSAVLPAGITTGTAVYAVAMQHFTSGFVGFTCNGASFPSASVPYGQQAVLLSGVTGANIGTVTCTLNTSQSLAGSNMDGGVSQVALWVDTTDTLTNDNYLKTQFPLLYSNYNNALSISPYWPSTIHPVIGGNVPAPSTTQNAGQGYPITFVSDLIDTTPGHACDGGGTGYGFCISDGSTNKVWAPTVTAGSVSSVSNSDSTLTISPTTGAVVASLNLTHANTWTAKQTQPAPLLSDITGSTQCLHVDATGQMSGTGSDCGSGGGGGGPTPFSYTLYIDTGTVKAQNNQTQTVDYSNTDAAVVINDILTARAATGATIYFKNGTYNLNSVFHETTGGYNLYCSICVQPSGSNNAQPSFNFIGESSQSNTANEGTAGVFLNLTTAAETAAGAGNIIAAFFVRPTLTQRIDVPGLYWGPRILIHDVSVVLPANTRGNEHALDTLEASYLELINSQFTFATYSTALGASNLYAVISPDSPSAGAYIRDTGTAPGFGTGFSINANHSILVNTSAYSATTCYTYGELTGTHGTPLQHSSTWIHVEPYDCVNDFVAGANLGNAAEIDLLNYDIEYITTGPWAHVKGIDTVTNGNKLGGHISWDNFQTGVGVGSLTTPFTSGSGTHFDVFDAGTAILQWMQLYSLSSDPSSPSDGTLWYNSVGHQLKAQINGSTVVLGSGFTNPMTTLGDVIYGGASGTATRLAGPTTSTHQFLLGDVPVAGAAVAPAWFDLGPNLGSYVSGTSPIVVTQNANSIAVSCPTCGTSSSTNVTVNGGAGLGTANLNDTTPAAAANGLNVKWQNSTSNVSAYVPGDGNSAHFLSGTGTWATPSGSSGLTQISQVTTTASATTITFSSIPGTYTNLYLTCTEQNSGSSNPGVTFIYNNDSGANYFEQFLHTANTTVAGGSGTNNSGFLGSGTPSSIGANYVSNFFMRVYNYANTSWYKTSHGTGSNFTSTTAVLETQETNIWKSTAAITSIKIGLSTADHFTDGTVCTLYGEQ